MLKVVAFGIIFIFITPSILACIALSNANTNRSSNGTIQARILVDIFHYNDYEYAFNVPVINLLERNKYIISYLFERIKESTLEDFEIFAVTGLFGYELNYTQDEINRILKFVYEGGGLLIIFHTGIVNFLGKQFGMQQSNNFVWDPAGFYNFTEDNPITSDVILIKQGVYGGGTLNVTSPAKGLVFGDNDTEVAWIINGVTQQYRRESGLPLLAVAQYGLGRIVGVTLAIWDAENPKLLLNILKWLAGESKISNLPPKFIQEITRLNSAHFIIDCPKDYIDLVEPMLPYLDKSYDMLKALQVVCLEIP